MPNSFTCPVVVGTFPLGTTEGPYIVAINGTDSTGATFSTSESSTTLPISVALPAGTFTAVITKNGASSLASASFTVASSLASTSSTVAAPTTISFSIPDVTQQTVVTQS